METCKMCGFENDLESGFLDKDGQNGYWCDDCDTYNYCDKYKMKETRKYTLILEDKTAPGVKQPKHKIELQKRLSPLRYPGGKSKLIDYLYSKMDTKKKDILISPFTGGGSFELAMLKSQTVDKLHMNDLDFGVYSLWWTIKHLPDDLIFRLSTIEPEHKDFFECKELIQNNFIGATMLDAAWATLLVNRLAFSGIPKANPMGGKTGDKSKLLSRWNPKGLINRIKDIHSISDRYEITNLDALEIIEEGYWNDKATIFIDPPYVQKGKDLYNEFYTEKDHLKLALLLDSLYEGMPGADLLLTYDYDKWLEGIYRHPDKEIIGRVYSI